MRKVITIAFTGPRATKLCGYDTDKYNTIRLQLANIIKSFEGYTETLRVLTGGAQGIDQLAFQATEYAKTLTKMHIENIVYVPFEGHEMKWSENGLFSQSSYRDMLRTAKEANPENVKYLYGKPGNQNVGILLNNRNKAMVDDCDMLIAIYSGDYKVEQHSGTANCIKYATKTMGSNKAILIMPYDITNSGISIRNEQTFKFIPRMLPDN